MQNNIDMPKGITIQKYKIIVLIKDIKLVLLDCIITTQRLKLIWISLN